MQQFLDFITFKNLKGQRTQITIVIATILNFAVSMRLLNLTPETLGHINALLVSLGGYFLADKLTPKGGDNA